MKSDIALKERLKLLEKEIATLADKIELLNRDITELRELKNEIKGLKLFLGRVYPDFKTKYPEIIQKVYIQKGTRKR